MTIAPSPIQLSGWRRPAITGPIRKIVVGLARMHDHIDVTHGDLCFGQAMGNAAQGDITPRALDPSEALFLRRGDFTDTLPV